MLSTQDQGIRQLSATEIEQIGGAGFTDGAAAFGAGLGLGAASLGVGFGAVAAGTAIAAAPITVVAMLGLAGYAGYSWGSSIYNHYF